MSKQVNITLQESNYTKLQTATMAIRAVSDLLLNMQHEDHLEMVRPENLQALLDVLAEHFEQALASPEGVQ